MPEPKFSGLPHPIASEERNFNNENGSDAEVFAGAYLIMATGGEISWGSREEDGSKIDLLLSFPNQWSDRGRKIVLAQVKSGPGYGKVSLRRGELKADLNKNVFEASFTATNDMLLLWVDRKNNHCFWTYVFRGAKPAKRQLNSRQLISPALRYDLARIIGSSQKDGGKGLIFSTSNIDFKILRDIAEKYYRSYAVQTIISPLFGPIAFTKSGWRHMARKSRNGKFKQSSYEIMPLLPNIIERTPDYHEVQNSKIYPKGEWTYRDTVYLLVYQGVKVRTVKNKALQAITVYLKIEESMVYPGNWHQTVQRLQLVDRHCKSLSVYYNKKIKKRGKTVSF